MFKKSALIIICIFLQACSRLPLRDTSQAMRPVGEKVSVSDDLPLKTLVKGLIQSIDKLSEDPEGIMKFGSLSVRKSDYADSLEAIVKVIKNMNRRQELYDHINNHFDFYEVYGEKEWGDVFITSYFDPVVPGSLRPTKEFVQALYQTPKDMVTIDIGKYSDVFPRWKLFANSVLEQKSRKPIVRGRLIATKNKNAVQEVVPFYDRKAIDEEKKLKGRKLEIVYVSPIDSFFLQIQGSGIVKLPSGKEFRVGYDSQNGHPYVAIGRFLLDEIPLEEMSMQKIEAYLQNLSPEEQQKLLNKNPSYVFFRKINGASQTYFSTDVLPGRTIATDYGYFPKGALAFLEFNKPIFANDKDEKPMEWAESRRLVLDHDTGGAIRGPGRLDLYWGKGSQAKQSAGIMKQRGRLTYLVPKNINALKQQ